MLRIAVISGVVFGMCHTAFATISPETLVQKKLVEAIKSSLEKCMQLDESHNSKEAMDILDEMNGGRAYSLNEASLVALECSKKRSKILKKHLNSTSKKFESCVSFLDKNNLLANKKEEKGLKKKKKDLLKKILPKGLKGSSVKPEKRP